MMAFMSVGYRLGNGGSVETLGGWAVALWGIGCLIGVGLFYRRGRPISFALGGCVALGMVGTLVGAAEVTRTPVGMASYATVGLFIGLLTGFVTPARHHRSGSQIFFLISGIVVLTGVPVGVAMLHKAMAAPWNCANLCQLSSVKTLWVVDALVLSAVLFVLALTAGRMPTLPKNTADNDPPIRQGDAA